jgi:hypothetical protein
VIRLVVGSRIEKRLMDVMSFWCLFWAEAVFSMSFRASLGFLTCMVKSVEPYLSYRVRMACFIVCLVVTWCSLRDNKMAAH